MSRRARRNRNGAAAGAARDGAQIVRLPSRGAAGSGEAEATAPRVAASASASPTQILTLRRKWQNRMDLTGEYTIDELRAQAADALGVRPGLTLRLTDDVKITIPHPMFVDDDVLEIMQGGASANPVEMAKALLGEDFKILREHGGRSADVIAAWTIMNKSMEDTVPGAGTPTQPPTS